MAYPFAALERARASHINDAIGSTDWAAYTPAVTNGGSATFTTLSGRYRRLGPTSASMIFFHTTIVVNAAGSGASNITFTTPTNIDRTVSWIFYGMVETAGLSGVYAIALASGSGAVVDRVRTGAATNVTGADLTAGRILRFAGLYEEA